MRSRFRTVIVASLAVFAVGAAAASSALASEGGPEWLVAGAKLEGAKAVTSTGSTFRIQYPFANVTCNKESSTGGELIGGNPSTTGMRVVLTECHVESSSSCLLSSVKANNQVVPGEIQLPFKAVLAYPNGKAHLPNEADEAFVLGEAVTLRWTASRECGLVSGTEFGVVGSGTEIKEPSFNKKCALVAEVGKIEAGGGFAKTASGVEAVDGALNFPSWESSEPIVEVWGSGAKKYKQIRCDASAAGGALTFHGDMKVETVAKDAFGWQV